MKETIIENPTRIVDLHKPMDYIRGLYARVETPKGNYVATWEHMPEAGCVMLSPIVDGGVAYDDIGPCRNAVLIASLCNFQDKMNGEDWPDGCDIPVLTPGEADAVLEKRGIPDDDWKTFRILLAMD